MPYVKVHECRDQNEGISLEALQYVMQPLVELGIDSFGAVELRNTLEQAFAISLPATLAYDYPTMSTLAKYISEVLHPIPIQQHAYMGKTAHDQDIILIQERLHDIVGSILGTSISIDQVPTPPPSCERICPHSSLCDFIGHLSFDDVCTASYGSGIGIT